MKKNIDSIAFQGDKGAYQELVCIEHFPNHERIACKNFEDVFKSVENSEVSIGIIPIENSYVGRVSEIHNLLQQTKLSITGEYFIKINHCLATVTNNSLDQISTVISHPMALMQCKNNIAKYGFEAKNEINTAVAAKNLAEKPENNIAVICSQAACDLYSLKILNNNFQDNDDNYTHFVSIAREPVLIEANDKAVGTILFELKNQTAALYKALGVFSKSNINITKIESYIPGGISKNAKFLLSFEGNIHNPTIESTINELKSLCNSLKQQKY
jgi:prephenate dehydratase